LNRAEAVKESDLVVEAIIESLKVKGDLFKFLDDKARYVFLPTPASGLAADHQAGVYFRYKHLQSICYRNSSVLLGCSTREVRLMMEEADDRFAGLHFFNRKLTLSSDLSS
jgi:3-hydroxyacyl-CoA dehydrogenase